MELDAEKLYELVEKVRCANQVPSVDIYCSLSIIDDLKERWDEKIAKAKFNLLPYDDDRLFVIPVKEFEKSIKLVIPEEKERLRKYLGLESED